MREAVPQAETHGPGYLTSRVVHGRNAAALWMASMSSRSFLPSFHPASSKQQAASSKQQPAIRIFWYEFFVQALQGLYIHKIRISLFTKSICRDRCDISLPLPLPLPLHLDSLNRELDCKPALRPRKLDIVAPRNRTAHTDAAVSD